MKSKTKLILGAVALVAVVGGSAVLYRTLSENYAPDVRLDTGGGQTPTNSQSAASAPEPMLAPDFSMENADGESVKLSDFAGKPVVLNFWASWCPPCKAEMPDFDKVFGELGEDVHFIMLNATDGARETKEKAQDFLAKQDFSFPVYYDIGQEAAYAYGISSLPTTLFIDADGYLIAGGKGMLDEETLRRGIDMIQAEKSS